MASSRRQFLKRPALGLLGAAVARAAPAHAGNGATVAPPPGSPPAFGTGPVVGPAITPSTIAEAEKLLRITYTAAERAQAAGSWQVSMASLSERRAGPRKLAIDASMAPATQWNPVLPGRS